MDMSQVKSCMKSSTNITRHTMMPYLIAIHRKCVLPDGTKIVTGLPGYLWTRTDRWLIIVRVALYGIDYLIEQKQKDKANCGCGVMSDDIIRQRELAEQIKALKGMKAMAALCGFDISGPATTAKEAVQWLYFGYLAAIKTQNGAAMSVGRVSTFLDIYIERDLGRNSYRKRGSGAD